MSPAIHGVAESDTTEQLNWTEGSVGTSHRVDSMSAPWQEWLNKQTVWTSHAGELGCVLQECPPSRHWALCPLSVGHMVTPFSILCSGRKGGTLPAWCSRSAPASRVDPDPWGDVRWWTPLLGPRSQVVTVRALSRVSTLRGGGGWAPLCQPRRGAACRLY